MGLYPEIGVYGMPTLVAAAVVLANHGYGALAGFLLDHFPFFASLWLGSGFAFAWKILEKSATGKPRRLLVVAVIGLAGLLAVGGWELLTDPELFGVTLWPALSLIARALAGTSEKRQAP